MSTIGLPEGFVLPSVVVVRSIGNDRVEVTFDPTSSLTVPQEKEIIAAFEGVSFLGHVNMGTCGDSRTIKFTYFAATSQQKVDLLAELAPQYAGYAKPQARVVRKNGEHNNSGKQIGTIVTLDLSDSSTAGLVDLDAMRGVDDVVEPRIHQYSPGGCRNKTVVFSVGSCSRDRDYLLKLAKAAAEAGRLIIEDEESFRVVDNVYFAALPGYNLDTPASS